MTHQDRVAEAVERCIRGHVDYIGGTNEDGSIYVDGDVDIREIAQAAIDALGSPPDREFTDAAGRRWEWCGGVEGTWAWRVVALNGEQ